MGVQDMLSIFSGMFSSDQQSSEKSIYERDFFTNEISIDLFQKNLIKDIASLHKIHNSLLKLSIDVSELLVLEQEAFNLLINHVELQKGSSKVEVGVIGNFSSGKSTFINSLFKKEVCPMAVKPTTSSITKFYYGHQEKIKLNNKEITYQEYQNLAQHLKGDTKNTEAHFIEYAYPFESFNSIILYDTPGFGTDENQMNQNDARVTLQTLKSVDVILFVIDISKGSIDAASLELLKSINGKKLFCILNKSDLKSMSAVEKIKKEIEGYAIFEEVIAYSASKVLEEGKRDIFKSFVQWIEEAYIYKTQPFTTTIQGELQTKKSRLKSTEEYFLKIGKSSEIYIDSFYQIAHEQRSHIEKLLNRFNDTKREIVEHNFTQAQKRYDTHRSEWVKKTLKEIKNININTHRFDKFDNEIRKSQTELAEFEEKLLENFYNDFIRCFRNACHVHNVSDEEKSFWSTPYAKIHFSQYDFEKAFNQMEFFDVMKKYLIPMQHYFKSAYNLNLNISSRQEGFRDDFLTYISSILDASNYFKGEEGRVYYEDTHEARNIINEYPENAVFDYIKSLNIRTVNDYIWINNYEAIEAFKRDLHTDDHYNCIKLEEIKQELNNFLNKRDNNV